MNLTPLQIALIVIVFTCVCLLASHVFEASDGVVPCPIDIRAEINPNKTPKYPHGCNSISVDSENLDKCKKYYDKDYGGHTRLCDNAFDKMDGTYLCSPINGTPCKI
jgi:hypothetical protein